MAQREPETGRRAVVEDINGEAIEADHFGEPLDHARDIVECVIECFARGHVGLAEAGKVRGHDVKLVRKQRDQVAEHVAGARETVQ